MECMTIEERYLRTERHGMPILKKLFTLTDEQIREFVYDRLDILRLTSTVETVWNLKEDTIRRLITNNECENITIGRGIKIDVYGMSWNDKQRDHLVQSFIPIELD